MATSEDIYVRRPRVQCHHLCFITILVTLVLSCSFVGSTALATATTKTNSKTLRKLQVETVELTNENFEDLISMDHLESHEKSPNEFGQHTKKGGWLILFVTSSSRDCQHCHMVKDEYVLLTKDDDIRKMDVGIGTVDGKEHPLISTRFNIRGYPSIIFIRNGHVYAYPHEASFDKLKEFALGGYQLSEGFPIPSPPHVIHRFMLLTRLNWHFFHGKAREKSGVGSLAFVGVTILVCVVILAGMIGGIFFFTREKVKKS